MPQCFPYGPTTALGAALAAHVRQTLASFEIIITGTISFYIIFLCMPTFARPVAFGAGPSVSAQAISLACMTILTPIFGALSDHIGRSPIMIGALASFPMRFSGARQVSGFTGDAQRCGLMCKIGNIGALAELNHHVASGASHPCARAYATIRRASASGIIFPLRTVLIRPALKLLSRL